MRIKLIIMLILLNITSAFSDKYNPLIIEDILTKDVEVIDTYMTWTSTIKNEFLKNGFTFKLYGDIRNNELRSSIYFNNLFCLSAYDSGNIFPPVDASVFILATDGKNISIISIMPFIISNDKNDSSITLSKISNEYKINKLPSSITFKPENINDYKILSKNEDNLIIQLNKQLIIYNTINNTILNNLSLFENEFLVYESYELLLIRINNSKASIYKVDGNLSNKYLCEVTVYDDFKIFSIHNYLYFLTSTDGSNETFLQSIYVLNSQLESVQWINSKLDKIKIFDEDGVAYLLNIENSKNNNTLLLRNIIDGKIVNKSKMFEIDRKYYGFTELTYDLGAIVLIFKNGLIQFDLDLNVLSNDQFDTDIDIRKLFRFENLIILINDKTTKFIYFEKNNLMYFNLIWLFLAKYGFIIILLFIITYLTLTFRHKRRFFNEILRHPAIGCIYYLDPKGRLILANNEGQVSLKLNNNIPLKRNFHYYAKNELNIKVSEFIKKTYDNQKNLKEKIIISENGISKDWLINTFIIRNIAGMVRGVVVSVTDITEQLERQRLTNLASFAHDMQTNLSTIRLNAEQIECKDEFAQSKKKKILFQTNILTQRVRDLLAVGRDDVLDLEEVLVDEIVNKVYSEFDNELYPDISFQSSGNNLKVICDKNKIIRGIRNAVENSIKYLPAKKGVISINFSQTSDKQFYCFSVEDTGIGMDSDLKNKVLTPYFTTAKKTGGSGIGSIIMQKVAELHNGKIEIESELNKGTKVKFYLPINYLKSLKNNMN